MVNRWEACVIQVVYDGESYERLARWLPGRNAGLTKLHIVFSTGLVLGRARSGNPRNNCRMGEGIRFRGYLPRAGVQFELTGLRAKMRSMKSRVAPQMMALSARLKSGHM